MGRSETHIGHRGLRLAKGIDTLFMQKHLSLRNHKDHVIRNYLKKRKMDLRHIALKTGVHGITQIRDLFLSLRKYVFLL